MTSNKSHVNHGQSPPSDRRIPCRVHFSGEEFKDRPIDLRVFMAEGVEEDAEIGDSSSAGREDILLRRFHLEEDQSLFRRLPGSRHQTDLLCLGHFLLEAESLLYGLRQLLIGDGCVFNDPLRLRYFLPV